jgi:hypothetical protein
MLPRYLSMLGLARVIRQTAGMWCKWRNAGSAVPTEKLGVWGGARKYSEIFG